MRAHQCGERSWESEVFASRRVRIEYDAGAGPDGQGRFDNGGGIERRILERPDGGVEAGQFSAARYLPRRRENALLGGELSHSRIEDDGAPGVKILTRIL
jgi:hypothetical protein